MRERLGVDNCRAAPLFRGQPGARSPTPSGLPTIRSTPV
jgi:hypothetical protein